MDGIVRCIVIRGIGPRSLGNKEEKNRTSFRRLSRANLVDFAANLALRLGDHALNAIVVQTVMQQLI